MAIDLERAPNDTPVRMNLIIAGQEVQLVGTAAEARDLVECARTKTDYDEGHLYIQGGSMTYVLISERSHGY